MFRPELDRRDRAAAPALTAGARPDLALPCAGTVDGIGGDVAAGRFARLSTDMVGHPGGPAFDPPRPHGTPRKLLAVSRRDQLGRPAAASQRDGSGLACADFLAAGGRDR